jgi:hypothetical protein
MFSFVTLFGFGNFSLHEETFKVAVVVVAVVDTVFEPVTVANVELKDG